MPEETTILKVDATGAVTGGKAVRRMLGGMAQEFRKLALEQIAQQKIAEGGLVTIRKQIKDGSTAAAVFKKWGDRVKWVSARRLEDLKIQEKQISKTKQQIAVLTEQMAKGRLATDKMVADMKRREAARLEAQRKAEAAAARQKILTKNRIFQIRQQLRQEAIATQKHIEAVQKRREADNKVSSSMRGLSLATKKATNEMVLSWRSFERIILVQAIRKAFQRIIWQVREAVMTLMDFHKAIIEIQTISQTMPGTINQWSASLRKLSDAWGTDILDDANARYQILSNQIAVGIIQTERFGNTVNAFSKITKSTAEDSVNLLTASLNSYGKDASQVDDVAAKLFKTIELGRVRANELANTFGRASVPAAQLGITMEELLAMLASITIKGVKATESMTLLRGIFMKLNKPTTEMKDLLAELGVPTGEALIATYGLAESFRILYERTKGSSSAIAELFGRIRPTMGMAALLENLDRFNENLAKIEDQSEGSYLEALNLQFATSGEKLSREFTRLKNIFTVDYATTVTGVIVSVTEKFGGMAKVLDFLIQRALSLAATFAVIWGLGKLQTFLRHIEVLDLAFRKFGKSVKATAIAMQFLKRTMSTIAIFAAVEIIAAAVRSQQAYNEVVRESAERTDEWLRSLRSVSEVSKSSFSATIEGAKGVNQELNQSLAQLRIFNSQQLANIDEDWGKERETIIKEQTRSIETELKDRLQIHRDYYAKISRLMNEANEEFKDLQKQRVETARDTVEFIFGVEQQFRSREEQIVALRQRIATVGQFGMFTSEEDILKEKIRLNKELINLLIKQERERAKAKVQADYEIAQERIKTLKKQIAEENKLRKQQGLPLLDTDVPSAKRATATAVLNQDIKAQVAALRATVGDLQKIRIDKMAALQKQIDDYKATLEATEKSYNKMLEAAKVFMRANKILFKGTTILGEKEPKAKDFQFADLEMQAQYLYALKLQAEQEAARVELIKSNTETLEKQTTALNNLTLALNKSVQNTQQNIVKTEAELAQELTNLYNVISDEYKKTQRPFFDTSPRTEDEKRLASETEKLYESLSKFFTDEGDLQKAVNYTEVLSALASLKNLGSLSDIIRSQVKSYEGMAATDEYQAAIKSLEGIKFARLAIENITKLIADYEAAIQKQANLETEIQNITIMRERLNSATSKFITQVERLPESGSELLQGIQNIADGLERVYQNSIQGILGAQGRLSEFRRGGTVYANKGLFRPRGSDTVPAMLTPGEFVVNKTAAKQMFQQLVPMNYGLSPNQFANQNTPVNVGDVTVNVQGGNTGQQTALEIGHAIRREIRRGRLAI
jgi:TP901 family phage tail tape measure protein